MLGKVWDALFGCWHNHYSFPQTVRPANRRGTAAAMTGTYVVCLGCGKELAYDWAEMKIVDASAQDSGRVRELATKEAA